MSELRLVSTNQRSAPELVELFGRCFEGYVVPIHFTLESFLERMRMDLVDFNRSRIVRRGETDVAMALLSPRGSEMRVAAMGVAREGRAQGIGRWLLERIFDESSERAIELEVIVGNDAAIALYERTGFNRVEKLLGFLAEDPAGEPRDSLTRIPLERAARTLMIHGDEDLPWQCAAPNLLTLAHPYSAWQLGASSLILGDPAAEDLRIMSVVTQRGQRRVGQARSLLRAMFAQFPGRRWFVPPVMPERHAGLFRGLGMREHPISQWRMRREAGGNES